MSTTIPPRDTRLDWARAGGVALRGGALVVALLSILIGGDGLSRADVGALVALTAVAMWQTTEVVRGEGVESPTSLFVEAAMALGAVLVTGGWGSPFFAYASVALVFLGLRVGLWAAAGSAVVIVAAVSVRELFDGELLETGSMAQAFALVGVAVATGALAGSLAREAEQEHELTLGRIEQLGHVNAMLSTLHDLVRSMPAPLSVDEIVRVIRTQLDELFDADAVALLMSAGAGGGWRPVYAEGLRLPTELRGSELPEPVRMRGPSQRPVVIPDLGEPGGLWEKARSGVYLWLWSRGQATGLLVLEHRETGQVDEEHRDVLERLGVPLALAIDNAVWFQRLRTIGAEEERQRIGARLHDQFAQSLAYVAMELDRTVRRHADDEQLEQLHKDVRSTLADLRDTLRELRLKVTEDKDLVTVLSEHAQRFGDRFGVAVEVVQEGELVRPPLPIEQQLLRMAQDLLGLAQREMGATRVRASYETAPGRVRLGVLDDGRGIPEAEMGADARHLVEVLRERADAIGAQLELIAVPGEGSEATVTLRGLL